MADAQLGQPPLDLTVKSDPSAWAETVGGEVVRGNSIRLKEAGQVVELEGYEDGAWWVQDVAASLANQQRKTSRIEFDV